MTQHNNGHLTTEQLSALLDGQLSTQERELYKAHVQACQQCHHELQGLQQVVVLLHALPQPQLPHSFTLSSDIRYLQERPAREAAPVAARQPRSSKPSYLRRSIRIVSTIAAVVGLFFFLSSFLATLPRSATTSAPTRNPSSVAHNNPSSTVGPRSVQSGVQKQKTATPGNGTFTSSPTPAPTSRSSTNTAPHQATPASQPSPSLPLPGMSTPLAQQEVGLILLFLGILGWLLTVRRRKNRVFSS